MAACVNIGLSCSQDKLTTIRLILDLSVGITAININTFVHRCASLHGILHCFYLYGRVGL